MEIRIALLSRKQTQAIPVVDIFAGSGGLGEGFSSILDAEEDRVFRVGLSIEKEAFAHRTLRLRSFFRQFPPGDIPGMYYQHLRRELSGDALFAACGQEAEPAARESWNTEPGKPSTPFETVQERISGALGRDPEPGAGCFLAGMDSNCCLGTVVA